MSSVLISLGVKKERKILKINNKIAKPNKRKKTMRYFPVPILEESEEVVEIIYE